MKITVEIDDDLWGKAKRLSGTREDAALIAAGMRALVERESARRLARLGGSESGIRRVPRRRTLRHE